ncbi:unnamed protein product (macronuclear) [Paramecium tetraurelia]|uniref:Uncharacterized protein n=1 Tax=Paramecium tetraurelia TaxID=5888 RepID=A0CAL8_PARTE|nr:uncharacterized protein GSPATT00036616001 [Paramecium tetraurelia]CAK67835.1 unnamed protein product [Paramecium tetraurelia]|eukprot:XP_001435232.1 hypothetical protein (macronuclear) [Paramecium tetraurelia strain d4-2]
MDLSVKKLFGVLINGFQIHPDVQIIFIQECLGNCLECDDTTMTSCSKCIPGRDNQNPSDKTCSIDCIGFTSCSIVSNTYVYSNVCMPGTVLRQDRCACTFSIIVYSMSRWLFNLYLGYNVHDEENL